MKAFCLLLFILFRFSEGAEDVEGRITEILYQLDNFEFSFFQIRNFVNEVDNVQKVVSGISEELALLNNAVKVEREHLEGEMVEALSYLLKIKFARRRLPNSAQEFIGYSVMEYIERDALEKVNHYLRLLQGFSLIVSDIENVCLNTERTLNVLRESNWMLSQILSILILDRKETLMALRKEARTLLKVRPDLSRIIGREVEGEEREGGDFILPLSIVDIVSVKELDSGVIFYSMEGKKVRAVKGGEVIYSGWLRGYGNTVVIKHNGFYSVYAHLNAIYLKPGASVLAGTEIGEVGDTSSLYGTGLYFELRYGKRAVDVKKVYKNIWKEVTGR